MISSRSCFSSNAAPLSGSFASSRRRTSVVASVKGRARASWMIRYTAASSAESARVSRRLPGVGSQRGSGTGEFPRSERKRSASENAWASRGSLDPPVPKSASDTISSTAQKQAAGLEETVSSLRDITSSVQQNAQNAGLASTLAADARDVAVKGGSVVSEAVEAMSVINASSTRIADIITTIDEIAFQTNLLALNAAVEAARAGDQGRSFMVVANEVRALALRSADASKEIKTVISDAVTRVEEGNKLVGRAGTTLTGIISEVKQVASLVADIAAASSEQADGIEQVSRAVQQMEGLTTPAPGQGAPADSPDPFAGQSAPAAAMPRLWRPYPPHFVSPTRNGARDSLRRLTPCSDEHRPNTSIPLPFMAFKERKRWESAARRNRGVPARRRHPG